MKRCGYSFHRFQENSTIFNNIAKIQPLSQVDGIPINTIEYINFDKEAVSIPSKYNPPKMKTLLTDNHMVANIKFGDKTVQFLAVDGKRLRESEFNDPDQVIRLVNCGNLKPIRINQSNMSTETMTNLDAYSGSIWYCLFLYEIFNRVGIIDRDMVFLSVVNVNMANAFWNSHYMTYGNGYENGRQLMQPLTSIDVVGHESGHGIIEALGGLDYQGESGALNESIADIFGTCLEKYYDIKTNSKLFDWDMGEDFIQDALRSLSNPKKHRQPEYYQGIYWANTTSDEDQGGVHTNSGVSNFFYYTVSTGSEGTNEKGERYKVEKPFQMFKLAGLIYRSLQGGGGYSKIENNSNYNRFANCIKSNCPSYLKEKGLPEELLCSVEQGLSAIGLNTTTRPPQEPDPQPWPPGEPWPQDPDPQPWPPGEPWPQDPDPQPWLPGEPWPQDPDPQPWPPGQPWPQDPDPQPWPQEPWPEDPDPQPWPQEPWPEDPDPQPWPQEPWPEDPDPQPWPPRKPGPRDQWPQYLEPQPLPPREPCPQPLPHREPWPQPWPQIPSSPPFPWYKQRPLSIKTRLRRVSRKVRNAIRNNRPSGL